MKLRNLIIFILYIVIVHMAVHLYNDKIEIENLNDTIDTLKENTIPLNQYVDDINFMESTILELRGEFERECK